MTNTKRIFLFCMGIALGMFSVYALAKDPYPFCTSTNGDWVFEDVSSDDPYCPSIRWLADRNITLGCAPANVAPADAGRFPGNPVPNRRLYCPDNANLRKEAAVFIQRLGDWIHPPSCAAGQVMRRSAQAPGENYTDWECADVAVAGPSFKTTECVVPVAGRSANVTLPTPATKGDLHMVVRIESKKSNQFCEVNTGDDLVPIGPSSGNVSGAATFYYNGTGWMLVGRF